MADPIHVTYSPPIVPTPSERIAALQVAIGMFQAHATLQAKLSLKLATALVELTARVEALEKDRV